jgi:hypothetical protein
MTTKKTTTATATLPEAIPGNSNVTVLSKYHVKNMDNWETTLKNEIGDAVKGEAFWFKRIAEYMATPAERETMEAKIRIECTAKGLKADTPMSYAGKFTVFDACPEFRTRLLDNVSNQEQIMDMYRLVGGGVKRQIGKDDYPLLLAELAEGDRTGRNPISEWLPEAISALSYKDKNGTKRKATALTHNALLMLPAPVKKYDIEGIDPTVPSAKRTPQTPESDAITRKQTLDMLETFITAERGEHTAKTIRAIVTRWIDSSDIDAKLNELQPTLEALTIKTTEKGTRYIPVLPKM